MHERLAGKVHQVLSYALELKEKLDSGQRPSLHPAQLELRGLIERIGMAEGGTPDPQSRQIQYALACWLDEIFILGSPWRTEWDSRSLEVSMGFNPAKERAWRFPEMARSATGDLLEVCYLSVMLGFRGEWAEKADDLRAWVESARAQLRRNLGGEIKLGQKPPELDPIEQKTRHGREQMDRMAFYWGVALLVLVPLVSFAIVRWLFS
jgi:type IV/VI secretion system ImpK/VasF family protein